MNEIWDECKWVLVNEWDSSATAMAAETDIAVREKVLERDRERIPQLREKISL